MTTCEECGWPEPCGCEPDPIVVDGSKINTGLDLTDNDLRNVHWALKSWCDAQEAEFRKHPERIWLDEEIKAYRALAERFQAERSRGLGYKGEVLKCGFCYPREQHTNGEVKRKWSPEWRQFIPVCRKHALADGMIDGMENQGAMI